MCFSYDYVLQHGEEHYRTARKQHHCCECELPIHPGERYHEFTGLGEDGWESWRICAFCEWLRERIAEHEMESGCGAYEAWPAFTELYEALSDGHAKSLGLVDLLEYHE